jgi:hypothetical protein
MVGVRRGEVVFIFAEPFKPPDVVPSAVSFNVIIIES